MSMKVIASPFRIKPEESVPARSVERLYDCVFGPARFLKASHRLRQNHDPVPELDWVATEGIRIVGAIRYWPVLIGDQAESALLLGPLAVVPDRVDHGIGTALVTKTLALAARSGHDLVLLAGDPAYYRKFGFAPATPHGFVMPGEGRPDRLQVLSLKNRRLDRSAGTLRPADRYPSIFAIPLESRSIRRRAL
jgi:predicted N-acetyltransferase YhbS